MKRISIIAILMTLCSVFSYGQQSFFDKYAEMDGVTSVYITKSMLSLFPKGQTSVNGAQILQEINAEKVRIQQDVNAKAANLTDDKAKAELVAKANKDFAAFEQSKLEPVQKKIKRTIDKVAKTNNIQNVVNANIMVSGGKDLTQEVIQALNPKI